MKITDALLGEHGVLYVLFDHAEENLAKTTTTDDVVRLTGAFIESLITHAKIEEEYLFPAMEQKMGPMGPLAVMRAEHEEIEGTLVRLPSLGDAKSMVDAARHAIAVARDHFIKEEQVLFPMAENVLGESALLDLGRVWADKRRVAIR
ncbi:MAG: hemerythrin domain-containing protein [Deltaproteobacteria bacterium]|nr:hemerythrin domain-containing protein [Deltaproteobacteria bacterium]